MRRGRRPGGAKLVDGLGGSEMAKAKLRVILRTLAGEISIPEACAEIGVGEAMFHRMRSEYLAASIELLEPKTPGRKPEVESPEAMRVRELEQERESLKDQLYAAQVREGLALSMPHVLRPLPEEQTQKKRKRRRKRR